MADAPPSPTLHDVPYVRLFPWLRLFRVPGSAADPKRLMLAAVGLLIAGAGWAGLDRVFPDSAMRAPGWEAPWEAAVDVLGEGGWWGVVAEVAEPLERITWPFLTFFNPGVDLPARVHAALAGVWGVVVWGLVGGAIARVAVVDLARSERLGLGDAVRFAARKVVPLLGTPLIPLLGVAVVAAPVAAFGLLYRLPGSAGAVVAGALAFLPLIGGLLLAMILVGLAVGWPLMHASVAAEAEDGFDAMSRAYAYVHQRPWHYAAYALLTLAIGCVGFVFVGLFALLVVSLSAWALGLGGSPAAVGVFWASSSRADVPAAALAAHGLWLGVVGVLVRGWVYSYFWTAATAIYLLLRRDVDGTPWGAIAYEGRLSALSAAAADSAASGPVVSSATASVPAPHTPGLRDPDEVSGV